MLANFGLGTTEAERQLTAMNECSSLRTHRVFLTDGYHVSCTSMAGRRKSAPSSSSSVARVPARLPVDERKSTVGLSSATGFLMDRAPAGKFTQSEQGQTSSLQRPPRETE